MFDQLNDNYSAESPFGQLKSVDDADGLLADPMKSLIARCEVLEKLAEGASRRGNRAGTFFSGPSSHERLSETAGIGRQAISDLQTGDAAALAYSAFTFGRLWRQVLIMYQPSSIAK